MWEGPRGGRLSRQIFGYMMAQLSSDARSMSPEEEVSSRRGALKLLLMSQADLHANT